MEVDFFLSGPEETRRLGEMLGALAGSGLVLALTGDLGAGKTCFAQGLAKGLGVSEAVPVVSPTYTLANEYPGRVPLFHLDLYRLDGEEFAQSGLDEYFYGDGVTVIEWAEKAYDDLPSPRLEMEFNFPAGGGRLVSLRSVGQAWDGLLTELRQAWG
jgi:tRNA threonylcarbamoyladenosine biosynthesis protein TsaE